MLSKVLGIVVISCFAFFVVIFAQEAEVPKLYCRDDTGKPVEWFIVYKVPRNGNGGSLNSGSNYTYVVGDVIGSTSNSGGTAGGDKGDTAGGDKGGAAGGDKGGAAGGDKGGADGGDKGGADGGDKGGADGGDKGGADGGSTRRRKRSIRIRSRKIDVEYWHTSQFPIESKRSMVGRTLAPIYAFPADYAVAMYNDDVPAGTGKNDNKKGYSKGVIAMTEDSGIFITHSVPKFPPNLEKCYEYPKNGDGDMFMCISFTPNDAGKQLVKQISNLRPNVYEFSSIKKVTDKVPEFANLQTGIVSSGTNGLSVEDIKAAKGTIFKSYIRPTLEQMQNVDFYGGLLVQQMNESLIVKTNRPTIPSTCVPGLPVLNAKQVLMGLKPDEPPVFAFSSGPWQDTNDRARFVVTATTDEGSVCITDIDRSLNYSKRGGSAYCLKNDKVWLLFKSSLTNLQPCPNMR